MSTELRMLLAIVLSFLVFFLYQVFFVKETQITEIPPVEEETAVQQRASQETEAVRMLSESPQDMQPLSMEDTAPGRTITVTTNLYVAELQEGEGAFHAFRLRKYREARDQDAPMKEILGLPPGRGATPVVSFLGGGPRDMAQADFRTSADIEKVAVIEGTRNVVFTWRSTEGVTVTKTYAFEPDRYEVGLEVKVANLSTVPLVQPLSLVLRNNTENAKESRYTFEGPAALIDGQLEEIGIDDIEEDGNQTGVIAWVAYEDRYFATGLIPDQAQKTSIRFALRPNDVLETTYVDPAGPVAPQTERTYRYKLYFGPKSQEGLRDVASGFDKILDFGFFDIIAKPFLYVMNFIYTVIPNYGFAIIIITLLVKVLFWPLSNKSYQSMSQMKRLQPKLTELREKYKNDKKMMNQEMMNLYKVYKVNPLGGCLPMVLQIPVFFAFYKMLLQSIELRHAPFFLWINDLSAPDRLFDFGVKIPLMSPPYGIPVLTLIMGASMFLQQKMSPPPGDPAQAKMMMFMPIFFTFIFINFPSGLVLYWLVNNILSMAQQYYVIKKTA